MLGTASLPVGYQIARLVVKHLPAVYLDKYLNEIIQELYVFMETQNADYQKNEQLITLVILLATYTLYILSH